MEKTRFDLAKKEIVAFLEDDERAVFSLKELGGIYRENFDRWRLAMYTSRSSFVDYLCEKGILKKITINFDKKTKITRYGLRSGFPKVELFLSLASNAYLSHYTAMGYHQLTEQIPKTYYVNRELSPKSIPPSVLTQEGIDLAFSKPPRVSHTIAKYKGDRIVLLYSKNSHDLGIVKELWDGKFVRMTNIERTLIDCAVKPEYAGGVYEVAQAFQHAKGKASSNKIYAMFKKLSYIYPFHQVLGFYLELAGFDSIIVKRLADIPMPFKFYLTKGMEEVDYSKKWRLFYPKSFC